MIFRREHGKANVASLVERKTRYAVLFRNNDRSSKHFFRQADERDGTPAPNCASIDHI